MLYDKKSSNDTCIEYKDFVQNAAPFIQISTGRCNCGRHRT